jgi:hypothetical protein
MAALTDDGSVIGNILTELRAAYPTINWKCNLNSNMIRGYYSGDHTSHILLLHYYGQSQNSKFEASLRCFRVSCNVMDKDAVKAVRKLRKELLAKEKELKEVLTHIPTKRLENKNGRRNKE